MANVVRQDVVQIGFEVEDNPISVSYTHLDVYKRQELYVLEHAAQESGFGR